jgi:hypothetical protein
MRKWLLLAVLLLTACGDIRVDDLGPYWNKGELDPAFEGKWYYKDDKTLKEILVVNKGGMYRIDNPEKKKDTLLFKTLHVGNYNFLMTGPISTYTLFGPTNGDLIRYTIKGDTLRTYGLNAQSFSGFLKENYSQASNVIATHDCKPVSKKEPMFDFSEWTRKDGCYDDIKITKLDEAALGILSNIPESEIYWGVSDNPLLIKIHN